MRQLWQQIWHKLKQFFLKNCLFIYDNWNKMMRKNLWRIGLKCYLAGAEYLEKTLHTHTHIIRTPPIIDLPVDG